MKEDTQLAEDCGKTMETQNLACRRKAEPKQVQMVSEASAWGHRAVWGPGVLQTPRKTAPGTGAAACACPWGPHRPVRSTDPLLLSSLARSRYTIHQN